MLTTEFANTFFQVTIVLFVYAMAKLKLPANWDLTKAIHFITGS